ncbi:hypothetical protein HPB47_019373, partial [Ixodes persulcatus]
LHQEFIAITGVDLESKLLAFINKYGDGCLYLVKSGRCAKETVQELEADLEKLEGDARKCLNVEVVDIIAGVRTVMEIYWIFNIKHSSQNKNTLALLEHVCGLPSAPQTPL